MIVINPYSFYAWWAGVTFPTWDPASPYLNSWSLSGGNLTATLGDTTPNQVVRATNPVKGVSSGKVRGVEFKMNSVGPMTGTKVYAVGFLLDRTSSAPVIMYQFYNGAAYLRLEATATQSGSVVYIAAPVLSSGDVLGFTFDMSATNIAMRVYRNGSLVGGPYSLSSAFNGGSANVGLTASAHNVGGAGTNAMSVSLRTRITELQYLGNYTGVNDGFWA